MEVYGVIDRYDKHGCLLTEEQIVQRAKKQGLCHMCRIRTHNKRSVFLGGNIPITNENVYNGLCIEHNQDEVPSDVLAAWKERNKPHLRQVATAVMNARRFTANAKAASEQPQPGTPTRMGNMHLSERMDRKPPPTLNRQIVSDRHVDIPQRRGIGNGRPQSMQEHRSSSDGNVQIGQEDDKSHDSVPMTQDPLLGYFPENYPAGDATKKKLKRVKKKSTRRPSDLSSSSRADELNTSLSSSLDSKKLPASSHRKKQEFSDTSERSLSSHAYAYEDSSDVSSLDLHNSSHSTLNASGHVNASTNFNSSRSTLGNRSAKDDWQFQPSKYSYEDIVELLASHAHDDDITELRGILHSVRNQYEGGDAAILEPLRQLMSEHEFEPRIMDLACGVLWRMAADDLGAKRKIVESGSIELVMDALGKCRGDPMFSKWAMGTMSSIALVIEYKDYISQKNAIESILETLKEHKHVGGVFEWSCRCLLTLLVHNQYGVDHPDADDILSSNMSSIEDFNGIHTIIEAMKANEKESVAQTYAVDLLWRFLDVSDEKATSRIVRKFVEAGLVPLAARLLGYRSASAELYDKVAELICVILSYNKDDDALIQSVTECVSPVLSHMARDPKEERIQRAGLRILAVVSILGDIPVQKFHDKRAQQLVIKAMKLLLEDDKSVTSGLLILWKFSSLKPISNLLPVSDIKSSLKIMKKIIPLESYTLEKHAAICGFLSNVAGSPDLEFSYILVPLSDLMDVSFEGEAQRKAAAIAANCIPFLCRAYPDFSTEAIQYIVDDVFLEDIRSGSCEKVAPLLQTIHVMGIDSKIDLPIELITTVVIALSVINAPTVLKSLVDFLATLLASSGGNSTIPPATVPTLVNLLANHKHELYLCQSILDAMARIFLLAPPKIDSDRVAESILAYVASPTVSDDTQEAACSALWALLSADNPACNSGILAKIFSFTVNILEGFVGDSPEDFDADLVHRSCGVLASVGANARTAPIAISLTDVDVMVAILYLSMDKEESSDIPCLVLEAVYHFCLLNEEVLVKCGAIVAVADTIQKFNHEPKVLEIGFSVLAQLCSTENVSINLSIFFSDGVDFLLHGMSLFPEEKILQTEGCRAFSHLSIEGETRTVICEQGGIDLIATSLDMHQDSELLVEHGCSALFNLTSDAPDHTIEGFEIVPTIVSMLSLYQENASVKQNCLGILQNISMRGAHAKDAIARCGGLDAVLRLIHPLTDSPDVLERGFTTLWSLAVLGENRERIRGLGGVESAVQAMLTFVEYEGVQQQACGCICTLSMDPEVCDAIVSAGGCFSLLYAMRVHFSSLEVQSEAVRALEIIYTSKTSGISGNNSLEEELNAILMAMRRFADDESLQTRACSSLSALLAYDRSALSQETDDALRLVRRASSKFPRLSSEAARVEALLRRKTPKAN